MALAFGASAAWAQKTVTFAYQDMMNPWRWVQQTGEIEKATGFKINWRQFGGGGDVIRAMASGDVQLGEVGSTGIATAISQGMDVELFWILEDIAAAEALVVRNGSNINTIADLKGKKIATPFVSTSHFQLLYALDKAGIKPSDAQILNMRPPEIAAAWGRGDIDATFIWDPVLTTVKKDGKVLMTSGDICKQGACTFDGLDRHAEVREGESGVHGCARQGNRQGGRRLQGEPRQVVGNERRGEGGCEMVGRQGRGRSGLDEALRLPEPQGAGLCGMARRRREWRGGEGAHAAGELPEGAGPAAVRRSGLLEVRHHRVGDAGIEVTVRRSRGGSRDVVSSVLSAGTPCRCG